MEIPYQNFYSEKTKTEVLIENSFTSNKTSPNDRHYSLDVNNEILFLAIEYLDLYLQNTNFNASTSIHEDLFLIAGICIFIASKFLYNLSRISLQEIGIYFFDYKYSL